MRTWTWLNVFSSVLKYAIFKLIIIPWQAMFQGSSWKRCYKLLDGTSRSFALVIRFLPLEIRDAVCIYYLVLRALDTVEDESLTKGQEKQALLENFYLLLSPNSTINEEELINRVNIDHIKSEMDYTLVKEFPIVKACFKQLKLNYQNVIIKTGKEMGKGMGEFVSGGELKSPTFPLYEKYCHYAAGLVGLGLTEIFGELEERLDNEKGRQMGCFLQKVNIIRDLQKDFHQKRIFWPLKDLPSFSLPSSTTHDEIVGLKHDDLNLLCLDAVTQHYDAVIDYLAQLRNPGIFRFCAVPVLMALASLAKLYDHPAFFTVKVIKLSKLQSIQIFMECTDMAMFNRFSQIYLTELNDKISSVPEKLLIKKLLNKTLCS